MPNFAEFFLDSYFGEGIAYEENILTFVYILQNQPELFLSEERSEIIELLKTLPDNVEEISNAIALWCETHPLILDAILNIPIEGLDLRAADGRRTPMTGTESKDIIENSVVQSSKSSQPDSASSQDLASPPKDYK